MNFTYTLMAYIIVFLDWVVANSFWIFLGLATIILIAGILIYIVRYFDEI